jgi:SAM-dependent methyltransferase
LPQDIHELQRDWDLLANDDPLWAVLSDPAKRGGGWTVDEFLATGRQEVGELFAHAEKLGVNIRRERALDFGCGPGRIAQALCDRFDRVDGVDIAPGMVELGRKMNRYGKRCVYHVNDRPELALFADDTFDLVHSTITLQHMSPPLALSYLAEFARVLAPNGLIVVHIPDRVGSPIRRWLRKVTPLVLLRMRFRRRYGVAGFMDMNCIPRQKVAAYLESLGLTVVDADPTTVAGRAWPGFRYYAI